MEEIVDLERIERQMEMYIQGRDDR